MSVCVKVYVGWLKYIGLPASSLAHSIKVSCCAGFVFWLLCLPNSCNLLAQVCSQASMAKRKSKGKKRIKGQGVGGGGGKPKVPQPSATKSGNASALSGPQIKVTDELVEAWKKQLQNVIRSVFSECSPFYFS